MRKTYLAAVAATAVAFAGPATAGPQWTYADLGYTRADSIDQASGPSLDSNAFGISGSLAFAGMWHAGASYSTGEVLGVDVDQWNILVGAHPAVSDSTDLVFELGYGNIEDDDSSFDFDIDAISLAAGVRSMVTERLELNAKVSWTDLDLDENATVGSLDIEGGDVVSGEIGGRYLWGENFSAGLTYVIDDPAYVSDSLTLNFRWAFGDVL